MHSAIKAAILAGATSILLVSKSWAADNPVFIVNLAAAWYGTDETIVPQTVDPVTRTYLATSSVLFDFRLLNDPSADNFHEVAVTFHTEDLTAKAGVDYAATSGTVHLSNNTVVTIGVPIYTNSTIQGPRTFKIVVDTPSNLNGIKEAIGVIGD